MKKVALIEFNSYHDECLYSQIRFLADSNYSVTLIVNPKIFVRATEYLKFTEEAISYPAALERNFAKRLAHTYKLYRKLKNDFDYVVFNTASSRLEVILLSHLLKRKTQLIGIVHNLKKINHSFSQQVISAAIKKYFVLNDFLENSIELKDKSIQLKSFYPIFFPEYDSISLVKPENEVWISIPGKLDFGRRDYYLVAEALQKTSSKENLKVLILGNTNLQDTRSKDFIAHIKAQGISTNFVTFESFIENADFHAYIQYSDYILVPLEHVGDNYSKYKIMGCYNLAFGYKKNLIAPSGLKHIEDLSCHSLFYENVDDLAGIFENLNTKNVVQKDYVSEKWSYEAQRKQYVNFLENN